MVSHLIAGQLLAQIPFITPRHFFEETSPLKMTLEADFSILMNASSIAEEALVYKPAQAKIWLNDTLFVFTDIEIRPRGSYRRTECSLPPLMINFKADSISPFRPLGKLKFVWFCTDNYQNEQWVMKEFLTYKIYNALTPLSFNVRAIDFEFRDSRKRIKPLQTFAFLIEDLDDLAKRNQSLPYKQTVTHTEQTDRQQTTLVALFEYMIGNTDWAVPLNRNIKLMRAAKDSLALPWVIPYDFDYCGLVDASYAVPPPELPITSVRQRIYRGFLRTEEELQRVFQQFNNQHAAIEATIHNFQGLNAGNKREMIRYINTFYKIINDPKLAREAFIKNARK